MKMKHYESKRDNKKGNGYKWNQYHSYDYIYLTFYIFPYFPLFTLWIYNKTKETLTVNGML